MLTVHCPDCNQHIRAEDIELQTLIARCRACNSVFEIDSQVPGLQVDRAPPFQSRPAFELPEWYVETKTADGVTLQCRWGSCGCVGCLVLFVLVWFGMGAGLVLLFPRTEEERGLRALSIVGGIMLLVVGSLIFYTMLVGVCNSTTITIREGQLTIRHGPLPSIGGHPLDLNRNDIEQIYCEPRMNNDIHDDSLSGFKVIARLTNGNRFTLIHGLNWSQEEEALALEQWLERHLGIEDAPVPGEVPRG